MRSAVLVSPVILPVVLWLGFVGSLGSPSATWAADPPSAISAQVQVLPLARKTLTPTIQTYGQVIADPTKTLSMTTQVGGQVTQLMVEAGQWVHQGQKLLVLTLDPKARLDYQKARTQLMVAEQDLQQKQYLFARQMATKQAVVLARKAVSDARKTVRAQEKIGSNVPVQTIRASEDGLVLTMPVSVGTLVPPGGVLLSLSSRHALLLRLGIEPEDAPRVARGMAVTFDPVFSKRGERKLTGRATVVRVDGQINPATRLLDVVARPTAASMSETAAGRSAAGGLIAGMTLVARIALPPQTGFVVPTDAVLDSGPQGPHVFVVHGGRAVAVAVHTGSTVGGQTLVEPVTSGALRVGDSLVVVGQYPLQPGMAVRIQSSGSTTGRLP